MYAIINYEGLELKKDELYFDIKASVEDKNTGSTLDISIDIEELKVYRYTDDDVEYVSEEELKMWEKEIEDCPYEYLNEVWSNCDWKDE